MDDGEKRVREAIADAREYFDRAVLRSAFAGVPAAEAALQALVAETRAEFERLEAKIPEVADREALEESARALARMRAYLLPMDEVRHDATSILSEMTDWGVPGDVLDRIGDLVGETRTAGAAAARAALYQLYAESDYWDGYVDWWNDQLKRAAWIGAPLTLATLVLSIVCLRRGLVIPGFVLGGATGAGLSVLLRLPRLAVFGKLSDFWIRATRRYLSGTLAAVLGMALLQTGILVIPVANGGDVAKVVSECASSCGIAGQVLLFGVAMALGFSERVISSFADSLVGTAARGRQAAGRPVGGEARGA
ncbi:MAG TPA: hypothetical protein VIW03_16755 [Anaeromyxobacter sp.]